VRGGEGTTDCRPAVAARAASREPGCGSATATTMAPGSAAKLYKCSRPIMPTPMMPYRNTRASSLPIAPRYQFL
jgi:hypothetical protein